MAFHDRCVGLAALDGEQGCRRTDDDGEQPGGDDRQQGASVRTRRRHQCCSLGRRDALRYAALTLGE
jgi:hypothetical protein